VSLQALRFCAGRVIQHDPAFGSDVARDVAKRSIAVSEMSSPSASPAPRAPSNRPELSIVVPVHNEADNLPLLVERLKQVLDGKVSSWELVCVDDGSRDGTLSVLKLLSAQDRRISAVSFSRNFGKEIAIAAGLDHASGDAVVIMDADLQHPPETILVFLEKWREGFLNVYGQRSDRNDESRLKRNFAKLFYRLFASFGETELPEGAGDFRLLDRKVVDALRALPERARFSKGLYAWVGFASTGVTFDVAEREHGQSKFKYRKLFSFAFDGLSSFSTVPLKIATWTGAVIALISTFTALYFAIRTLVFGTDLPGFPSLIVSIMFFSGIQLVSLGMIGEYVGRIFAEVKRRPLYLIGERVGFDARTVDHPRGDALPPLIR
jgi:glycosyltransferase involved in cell wall biosynthesis